MAPFLNALRNKYLITTVLFAVWILFIDQNNIINQVKTRMKLSKLEKEKVFFLEEIAKGRDELSVLQNDPVMLEKLARERYLMKKDNEEIFVFSGR